MQIKWVWSNFLLGGKISRNNLDVWNLNIGTFTPLSTNFLPSYYFVESFMSAWVYYFSNYNFLSSDSASSALHVTVQAQVKPFRKSFKVTGNQIPSKPWDQAWGRGQSWRVSKGDSIWGRNPRLGYLVSLVVLRIPHHPNKTHLCVRSWTKAVLCTVEI